MTKLRWKLPINPASHVCSLRCEKGEVGRRPSAGNTARDTPAPGPVDKMSNVPVKVFMPNLIMLMRAGWCWWGWPQVLAVMVTTPRNFRSSLLMIKKGPTFIFTTFSLHTSYPCPSQSKVCRPAPLSFEVISQTFFLIFPAFAFNQLYESVYKEYHPIHGQIIH